MTKKIPPSTFLSTRNETAQWAISFFTKPNLKEGKFVNMKRPQDYNKVLLWVDKEMASVMVGDVTLDLTRSQARSLALQIIAFVDG
ncbi:hypothetical protein [Pseudomonas sp. W5-01]|uniref:hypothetical protein n=1 Tax=Pseudomonas sp. W5-01 TaxID=3097454 RepID=UPI00397879EE